LPLRSVPWSIVPPLRYGRMTPRALHSAIVRRREKKEKRRG
jgi:hypothetical protein